MTADVAAVWHLDLPYCDPVDACAAFGENHDVALFDSTGPLIAEARFSYLAVDPFRVISLRDGTASIDGVAVAGDPLTLLGAELAAVRIAPDPSGFAFRGGAAGYVGYEFGAALERVAAARAAADDPPDLFIGLYDLVIGFDRVAMTCRAHATGLPQPTMAGRRDRARARLDWVRDVLAGAEDQATAAPDLAWRPAWDRAGYRARLGRLLEYIAAGDIFQANLTMRWTADRLAGHSALALHQQLRRRNPAPFGAFLRCGAHALCCTSPERFLRLSADGAIEARPIKGTVARASGAAADAAAAAALLASAKDRAENVMIVDVLRNDLGRVAAAGSVAVPSLCALESFASVHHLVSRVTARLGADADAVGLLRAALPGGSITGAPKIRAMQIIAELEGARRGIYCGCVLYIGYDGAMDSNIVIRSVVVTPTRLIAHAGGGIVADSDPGAEYAEMMLKAQPMVGPDPDARAPVWLNGRVAYDACIDPHDRGFTLGDGVFETVLIRNGAPVHLDRHLGRMRKGAALLRICVPADNAAIGAAIAALPASPLACARITLTRGPAPRGVTPPDAPAPTLLIEVTPYAAGPDRVSAIICRGTRRNQASPLCRIKSLNYLDLVLARLEATEAGAGEAILLNTTGCVAEASAANLVIAYDGALFTPPVADGALPGITRELLIERAGVIERSLSPAALLAAECVILTNSLGLRELARLDERVYDPRPELCERLRRCLIAERF